MKRVFTVAAFFWACTFTQQAQHPSFATQGEDKAAGSPRLIATWQNSDSVVARRSTPAYNSVLDVED